jgi:hypothetical protein
MGQINVLGRVFIRTGSVIAASGVRVVSGLVQRLGSLSFISDNAGCLGGRPFPRNGRIMSFGSHEVYVGTESVCRYPEQVLVVADPPSHLLAHAGHSACPVESAEVMMAGRWRQQRCSSSRDSPGAGEDQEVSASSAGACVEPGWHFRHAG